MYSRQVCGLVETGWILIWIRRFLCLACGRTMSLLPDRLHPWRWYAGTVIIEALFRHCILLESAAAIGSRFGRPEDSMEWEASDAGEDSFWFLRLYGVGWVPGWVSQSLPPIGMKGKPSWSASLPKEAALLDQASWRWRRYPALCAKPSGILSTIAKRRGL